VRAKMNRSVEALSFYNVTPLSPGSLKKHTVSCDTCQAIIEFKINDVRPYNLMFLEEGYVISCPVCTCLIKCESRLTPKEVESLKYKYQRIINNTAAEAALWKKHCGTVPPPSPQSPPHHRNDEIFESGTNMHSPLFRQNSGMSLCSNMTLETTSAVTSNYLISPTSPSHTSKHA